MRHLIMAAIMFATTVPAWAVDTSAQQQTSVKAHGVTPEDVLPDELDSADLNGTIVRKGSVGAFLANARILRDAGSSLEARDAARAQIVALVPALRALGVFDFFSIRDPALAALVEAAETK
jgi:hypothetical protein